MVGADTKQLPEKMHDYMETVSKLPGTPISDETLGTSMLYSSGTTGRPKGISRPLPIQPPDQPLHILTFLSDLWSFNEDMVYLSPAPLYHSAPQAAANFAIRMGATTIIMEKFDPLEFLK